MASKAGVRRKSSASNLLSNFSTSRTPSLAQTPTMPAFRDRDDSDNYSFVTSTMGDSIAPSRIASSVAGGAGGSTGSTGSGIGGNGIAVTGPDSFGSLVDKRVECWWYMRKSHERNELWFDTIMLYRSDIESYLESTVGQSKLQQRSRNFFILGLSLSPLFDIPAPGDMLRAICKVLDEWESWAEGGGNKGMKNLFKGQKPGKKVAGFGDYSSFQDSGESYLVVANLPFVPDYFQTIISLCEIIRQVYIKLGLLLLPEDTSTPTPSHITSFPNSAGLSKNPSSASTSSTNYHYAKTSDGHGYGYVPPPGSYAGIGHPPRSASSSVDHGRTMSKAMSTGSGTTGGAGSGKTWNPSTCELIMKADGKLKKIMLTFTRELESVARKAVSDELSSLIPGLLKFEMS